MLESDVCERVRLLHQAWSDQHGSDGNGVLSHPGSNGACLDIRLFLATFASDTERERMWLFGSVAVVFMVSPATIFRFQHP